MHWQIERHEWVESTNTVAMERARGGAAEGTVIVAEGQRGGRGRLGRSWESPYGTNLYASVILRPALAPDAAPRLTPVVGAALAEAIGRVVPSVRIAIKWPNDLLIDGKKVGGILSEASILGGRLEYVVVGFGLNVNSRAVDFSPALRPQVTSLLMATGVETDRDALLAQCLETFAVHYAEFVALPNGGVSDITRPS